jgi:hypothetical protein
VTLNNSTVSNNSAGDGGGFEISQSAAVTLNGSSSVDHNTATSDGGGVIITGTLTMNDTSTVHDNTAGHSGGGIFNSFGTLNGAVAGTNVYNNTPDNISSF